MLSQKPGGFSRYDLANAIRLPRLTLLTYGSFRATQSKRPTLCNRQRTICSEIIIPCSD